MATSPQTAKKQYYSRGFTPKTRAPPAKGPAVDVPDIVVHKEERRNRRNEEWSMRGLENALRGSQNDYGASTSRRHSGMVDSCLIKGTKKNKPKKQTTLTSIIGIDNWTTFSRPRSKSFDPSTGHRERGSSGGNEGGSLATGDGHRRRANTVSGDVDRKAAIRSQSATKDDSSKAKEECATDLKQVKTFFKEILFELGR